ncbi:hypothetical protein WA026_007807 [Henosepilachna vigintioctopunctata]|uniref:NADP-dependent oxidoreductase domain-containing protein n=1 Tax=Henosepilachna vigintioctopunctata TaxID=420089 RepID=A0AAW1U7Z4_9CUCU
MGPISKFQKGPPLARLVLIMACLNSVLASVSIASSPTIPTLTLNTGKKIPAIGYGTWQAAEAELEKALDAALEAGYRHIDTAAVYENEKVIGNVIKRWISNGKLKREDIFLVTKVPTYAIDPEGVREYLKKSLANLQMDYVDLYLVHTPFGIKIIEETLHSAVSSGSNVEIDYKTDLLAVWREMEKQVDAGFTKAIGISNFNKSQVKRILDNCKIRPSSLQVELHPYLQQNELVDFCKENNIVVVAYSPLGSLGLSVYIEKLGKKEDFQNVLQNPTIKAIAEKHSKTAAQVVLRFDVQRGIIPIPKSTNLERLKQNLDIFDFELDADDIQKLKKLDAHVRFFNFMIRDGMETHPEYPFKDEVHK